MSSKLHDLANDALIGSSKDPVSVTASYNGTGVDMLTADGRCFAIQHIGAFAATSVAGSIEESSDNSTFTAISGATFTSVTAAANLQVITFDRTKRYLRHVTVQVGAGAVVIAALIGEQKKQL